MIKHVSKKIIFSLLVFLIAGSVRADEGMWLISNIDSTLMSKMKALGLKLNSSQIYNEKQTDIRSAVAMFDNGCTGEFVSSNGLLFTNHHCGRDRVQQLSSNEKNYMRDGYWANQATEELPVKGLTVKLLIQSKNLTSEVKELLKKSTFRKVMNDLERQYSDSISGYTASLDAFSDGSYYISVYQTFKDVRLVGIPAESIGNFGGENDNFEWPRQSADFAVFRVYANENNLPATYAPGNRPYRHKAFLPVSLQGVKNNDFVMTVGYPFNTERFISSYQLKEDLDVKNKATALAKGKYVEVLEREMNSSESVRLKYSSKNFSAGNSYKLAAGLLKQVQLSPAFSQKQQEEEALKQWIQADTTRQKKYGQCLATLEKNYALQHDAKYAHALLTAALFSDAAVFGIRARQILTKLEDKEIPEMNKAVEGFRDLSWYGKKWIKSTCPEFST
ncbi:MAG: serine protease [Bacteroidetes bacterium]|nr:serine protease [Bacteroidota bacterium]